MFNTGESSEGENEDASTRTCHPYFKACAKQSSFSCGVKRHDRGYSEDSGGPVLYEPSSYAGEGQQRKTLMDSEKPRISCTCGKTLGNVTVHQCNNAVCELTPSHRRTMNSHQRTYAADEGDSQDQSLDVRQSTSLQTEADPHETKRSAPCQTVCSIYL